MRSPPAVVPLRRERRAEQKKEFPAELARRRMTDLEGIMQQLPDAHELSPKKALLIKRLEWSSPTSLFGIIPG